MREVGGRGRQQRQRYRYFALAAAAVAAAPRFRQVQSGQAQARGGELERWPVGYSGGAGALLIQCSGLGWAPALAGTKFTSTREGRSRDSAAHSRHCAPRYRAPTAGRHMYLALPCLASPCPARAVLTSGARLPPWARTSQRYQVGCRAGVTAKQHDPSRLGQIVGGLATRPGVGSQLVQGSMVLAGVALRCSGTRARPCTEALCRNPAAVAACQDRHLPSRPPLAGTGTCGQVLHLRYLPSLHLPASSFHSFKLP